MSREIGKLSALSVSRLKEQGLHSDGGGLYLRVTASGGKFWAFRYMLYGKAREMGLGALHALPLAKARLKSAECRKQLSEGIDPIAARTEVRTKARMEVGRDKTFRQCAEAYIEAHEAGWRNAKHVQQWTNTLKDYVYPVFGDILVQRVNVAMVMKVIDPIWQTKTETAKRIRGRIEVILDWAKVREYREGENPARWRGHLQNLLAAPSKVKKVRHQAALSYNQIGAFIASLRKQNTDMSALAAEFTILTASRTSEVIGATWDEIDFARAAWTIPSDRIKAGKEHRVALSSAAIDILKKLDGERDKYTGKPEFVFGGRKKGKPLSNMAMLALLRRMNRRDITVHGFRSTFRDWAAEQTNFPREVAEAALAHAVEDKVEAAYRRSDLFEKRRLMMEQWARYCQKPQNEGKVVEMKSQGRRGKANG